MASNGGDSESSSRGVALIPTELRGNLPTGIAQGEEGLSYRDGTPIPSSRMPSLILEPGMTIGNGRYELLKPLGHGGMAEVWRAMHIPLRTEVAIKFISANLTIDPGHGQEAMERFRLEAQIAARLGARSKHIVTVHDADAHLGRPYLVMELLEGCDLADMIDQGQMPLGQIADILDQVAEGLDAAHAAGVLHRDLKPSNILISQEPDGKLRAKIADFGIAKIMSGNMPVDRPRTTMQGSFIGTAAYMSPEQVEGRFAIDARSDLWALGVVVYEALTGVLPFERPTFTAVMAAIGVGRFDPPSTRRPGLPASLDTWCARALAQDRDARFSSARSMANSFRTAARVPAAAPSPDTGPGPRPVLPVDGGNAAEAQRRRRTLIAAISFCAFMIASMIGVFFWLLADEEGVPEDTPSTARVAPVPEIPTVTSPEVVPSAVAPETAPSPPPVLLAPPRPPTTVVPPPLPFTATPAPNEVPSVSVAPTTPPPPPRPRKKIDPSEIQ
ncbi:serine/threonine protein kinase [Chondromyces apiculatus DSM 436]|uniref:Serine/threonine protein kinase n=1 Tax=Chondromyces apiculatus DSM 436 TaxID=1192034 RepID=A0A017T3T0_9BACT|nr:serine/threonine protein kinase [Chondromyces apiculatus DSM 436]